MLERAAAGSLVLIDELGRATDPEEGGALGVAVLDAIRRRGAFTVASTHLLALKVYGASPESAQALRRWAIQNGSIQSRRWVSTKRRCEPTYVLQLGAPGKSAGLDIASRLGLDPALIEDARGRLSTSERDIATFLSEMHRKLTELDQERRALAERENKVAAREKSLEEGWEREVRGADSRDRAAGRGAFRSQFEQRARDTIGELSQKARAKVAKTSREFQESVQKAATRQGEGYPRFGCEYFRGSRAATAGDRARGFG